MIEENNYESTSETTTQLSEEIIPTASQEASSAVINEVTIGQLLRSKREARGLNLKTISQQTKVLIGLLEHLENDDLEKLPSKTYVRGFVKSTAKILGINQDQALDALDYTYNRTRGPAKVEKPKNVEIQNEAARNTLSTMSSTPLEAVKSISASSIVYLAKIFGTLIVVAVIGYNAKNLIEKSSEEKIKLPEVLTTTHLRSKPAPKVEEAKLEVKSPQAVKASEPMAINLIQDKKDSNQKSEMVINNVSLKTVSLAEKQFVEDKSIPADKIEDIFPSRYKVLPTKGVENVFVNATDGDSWVTYKIDDKEIKKFVLRQGRTLFLRGEKIRLFIGNSKVLKIFYNNNPISLNAKSNIKNVVFPEELKTKYLNPLFVFQKDGSVVTSEEYVKLNKKEAAPITTPSSPVGSATAPMPVAPLAPAAPLKAPVRP
jgi:cytoskeletal protein RodZ